MQFCLLQLVADFVFSAATTVGPVCINGPPETTDLLVLCAVYARRDLHREYASQGGVGLEAEA